MTYEERYGEYQEAIEAYLDGLFTAQKPYSQLYEAIRYSILGGGKRIRPVLTLEFARLGGINWRLALPFACALELVHNYSLIHDDLPCMDDDDLRRGKPTTHKAYGETLAILAGDALQPEAFRLILEAPALSGERKLDAMRVLLNACGADGILCTGEAFNSSLAEKAKEEGLLVWVDCGSDVYATVKAMKFAADGIITDRPEFVTQMRMWWEKDAFEEAVKSSKE